MKMINASAMIIFYFFKESIIQSELNQHGIAYSPVQLNIQ
jgi:hypothetical protein